MYISSWLTCRYETGGGKSVLSGATSQREFLNPGALRAITNLYRNEVFRKSKDSGSRWGWCVKVQTTPDKWYTGEGFLWRGKGSHCFGGDWYHTDTGLWPW